MAASTITTAGIPVISGSKSKKKLSIDFHLKNTLEGYRRLTFMDARRRRCGDFARYLFSTRSGAGGCPEQVT
jgi:hypothetical protein